MGFADYKLGARIVDQTMRQLLAGQFDSPEARVMLLAIGAQESAFRHRAQIRGPARGYWMFEQTGGVIGVLRHRAVTRWADAVCVLQDVAPNDRAVYAQLSGNALLACAFARLFLWTEPAPLPALGDEDAAWAYYLAIWRPGKPRPAPWTENYRGALEAVSHAEVST